MRAGTFDAGARARHDFAAVPGPAVNALTEAFRAGAVRAAVDRFPRLVTQVGEGVALFASVAGLAHARVVLALAVAATSKASGGCAVIAGRSVPSFHTLARPARVVVVAFSMPVAFSGVALAEDVQEIFVVLRRAEIASRPGTSKVHLDAPKLLDVVIGVEKLREISCGVYPCNVHGKKYDDGDTKRDRAHCARAGACNDTGTRVQNLVRAVGEIAAVAAPTAAAPVFPRFPS